MGLDGVELVLGWEEAFGISINDGEAYFLRTPEQVTDLVFQKLQSGSVIGNGNLPQRAFHLLRRSFYQIFGTPRRLFKLEAKIIELTPTRSISSEAWNSLRLTCGVASFPRRPGSFLNSTKTIANLVDYLVIEHSASLKTFDQAWSRTQVRDVVRAVIREQQAIRKFSDKADFVHDLGVD